MTIKLSTLVRNRDTDFLALDLLESDNNLADVANAAVSLTNLGVTATAAELNTLDGITANTDEINYLSGVTSSIQTQLDAKMTPTYTGDVDVTGELLVDSYNETYVEVFSSNNSVTIDCELGNSFAHTLIENTTIDFNNPPTSGVAYTLSVEVIQDANNSGYTVTWGANNVIWPGATAPTLTSEADAIDVFVLNTRDGGNTWYGFTVGQNLG